MTVALLISERDFTDQIRDTARLLGYRRYHTWLARHSTAGFPDEVLVRPPRTLFAELKAENGKLSVAQEAWLDALAACGHEVFLWRPSMFDAIVAYLRSPERPVGPGPGAWA